MRADTDVLSYLSEKSGVALWVLNDDGSLAYATVAPEMRSADGSLLKLLRYFAADSERPQVRRLDANELYASFRFDGIDGANPHVGGGGVRQTLIAGPAYELHPLAGGKTGSIGYLLRPECVKAELLQMPVVGHKEFFRFLSVLTALLCGQALSEEELAAGIKERALKEVLEKQLIEIIFDIREEERMTAYAPEMEREVLSYVENGEVEALKKFRYPAIRDPSARGTRYQSLFESVALVTLATRAAISGGLDFVVAFSLSDLYFKRLSEVKSEREVAEIRAQVLTHFAQKVREAHGRKPEENPYSPYITRSVRYIRAHLHYPIRLEDVAAELGINPKYLSRLFVTCLGEKFSAFVQRERVAEAMNLLENTDRTIVDVSNSLGFSSQSYFIKVFEKYAGVTPGKFLERKKRTE